MNLGRKLTSLKLKVQLPTIRYMHGRHDLTGNDDKSLNGESLICFQND